MSEFTIEAFARECKQVMASADDPQEALGAHLQQTLRGQSSADVLEALEAAIPPGADIGEMIVHVSPELTILYGRVPPRFQSGIHDHTVFACIGQLTGEEKNVSYQRDPETNGLRAVKEQTIRAGEVIALPADAVHSIENPRTETSSALHLYGGDFEAIMHRRHIWTSDGHEPRPFSFELLLRESVSAMRRNGNTGGLKALAEAVPVARAFMDEAPS